MTTRSTKPVARLVDAAMVRDGGKLLPLVVTIYPHGFMGLRQKGRRREEIVTFSDAYYLAIKQRVSRERAERKANRKGKS